MPRLKPVFTEQLWKFLKIDIFHSCSFWWDGWMKIFSLVYRRVLPVCTLQEAAFINKIKIIIIKKSKVPHISKVNFPSFWTVSYNLQDRLTIHFAQVQITMVTVITSFLLKIFFWSGGTQISSLFFQLNITTEPPTWSNLYWLLSV